MLGRRVVGLRGRTRLLLFSLLPLIAILPPGWAQTPPTVSRVAKIMPIADPTGRRAYELVLNGANFAAGNKATDNILVSKKYPQIVPCQPPAANDTTTVPTGCVTVQVRANGSEITYIGVPGDRAGDDRVTVWTGGPAPTDDAFVTVTYPAQPKYLGYLSGILMLAAALVFGAGGIVIALACLSKFRTTMADVPRATHARTAVGMFETLVIDPKTNTYSLASFQFAAWSLAFLLAYVWLFVGRVVVQGSTQFIDLPSDFATMLGATAGTAVVSTGIDAAKGSKGAGEKYPSMGDLVSNGGVFAAERFQFLIWTIVGITAYLVVTFNQPLDVVSSLPQVGTGILGLSGVSGLAYLGGKLARTPGPVIDTATTPVGTAGAPRVTRLTGQQLPLDPTGAYIVTDKLGNRATLLPGVGGMITAQTPAGATSGFATAVDVRLPEGFVFPGTIAAVTPDQQKAVVDLLDAPPAITSVASQPAAGGAPVRRLTGQQLSLDPAASYLAMPREGSTVTLHPTGVTGGPIVALQPAGATTGFATQVELTLPTNFALPGRLVVTNPDGQKTAAELPA
jgi:hypothetical protein